MKRIILIWIVSLLSIQAFSQSIKSEVLDFERIGDIYTQKTVINFGDTYILSQNGTNSEIYNVNSSQVAILPSTLYVKDFVVYGTEIFFCGTTSGIGFLAKSNINDLFFNNIFFWETFSNIQSLNEILLDDNYGTTNIACIGIDNIGESIFFHYRENINSYAIYKSTNQDEIFDDLILKDRDIITVGRDQGSRLDFILRGYDRNTLSTWENRLDNGTGWRYINRLLATPLDGNSIAIVGEGEDDGTNLITITSIVNLSNMSLSFSKWFGSYRYNGNQGEFALIKDIMYSTADRKLLILEEYPHTFSPPPYPPALTDLITSIMVLDIVPFATNRDAIYSYINGIDHKYNSLKEKAPYIFNAIGINPLSRDVEIWEGDRSIINGNCNLIEHYDLIEVVINPSPIIPVVFVYSNRVEWEMNISNKINVETNIICE